jgi:hypothetical protein
LPDSLGRWVIFLHIGIAECGNPTKIVRKNWARVKNTSCSWVTRICRARPGDRFGS